jgi:hypothetical protein
MFVFDNCTNLTVQDSHWEDLQMEVNRCKTVRIRRNLVERPWQTGGIGAWGRAGGGLAQAYFIEDNWIVDPSPVSGGAIIFQVDNPDFDNNAWRDITVRNNTIVYPAPSIRTIWPPAIKFGVSSSTGQPLNTVFDQIHVEGNKVYIDPGIGDRFSTDLGLMAFWTSYPIQYFDFDNTTVIDNTAYYNGTKNFLGARAYARGDNWTDG